jgi:hypothetical protein
MRTLISHLHLILGFFNMPEASEFVLCYKSYTLLGNWLKEFKIVAMHPICFFMLHLHFL